MRKTARKPRPAPLRPAAEQLRQRHQETRPGHEADPGPVAADRVGHVLREIVVASHSISARRGRNHQGHRCSCQAVHSHHLRPGSYPLRTENPSRLRRRASKRPESSSSRNSSTIVLVTSAEDVLHHADLRVVVEREVDVLRRHEVDGDVLAGRAADGEPERPVAGREQEERRRKDGPRTPLRVAVEAPRPLAREDVPHREIGELLLGRLEAVGHQVQKALRAVPERRPVELDVETSPGCSHPRDSRRRPGRPPGGRRPGAGRGRGTPTGARGSHPWSGTKTCSAWSARRT